VPCWPLPSRAALTSSTWGSASSAWTRCAVRAGGTSSKCAASLPAPEHSCVRAVMSGPREVALTGGTPQASAGPCDARRSGGRAGSHRSVCCSPETTSAPTRVLPSVAPWSLRASAAGCMRACTQPGPTRRVLNKRASPCCMCACACQGGCRQDAAERRCQRYGANAGEHDVCGLVAGSPAPSEWGDVLSRVRRPRVRACMRMWLAACRCHC